ncbi:MAG: hypothetical protein AAFN11_02890, partial [Chloroflexota bacterium]
MNRAVFCLGYAVLYAVLIGCSSAQPTEEAPSVANALPTLPPIEIPPVLSDGWDTPQLIGQAEQREAPRVALLANETSVFTWT